MIAFVAISSQKVYRFGRRQYIYVTNNDAANGIRLGVSKVETDTAGDGIPVAKGTTFAGWWEGDLWAIAAVAQVQIALVVPGENLALDSERTEQPAFRTEDQAID